MDFAQLSSWSQNLQTYLNSPGPFDYIVLLLFAAVGILLLFHKIRLPGILAYLLLGALGTIFSPEALIHEPAFHFLGEIGVAFLMFTLGLEFSFSKLRAMRKVLLSAGGCQVLFCTLATVIANLAFDLLSMQVAFVIGGALALSSTALVVKQLIEQREHTAEHGQLAISVLLFQDIAAVLFLILIPAISPTHTGSLFTEIPIALAKGVLVFVVLALMGQFILRPVFHRIAKTHSNELFMLATLVVALGAALLTEKLHLSMALGAFLAGMMLGETEFRHQIEIDIRPFKDVLLGMFFIVVGTLLNVKQLVYNWQFVAFILVALILLKTLIIAGICRFIMKVKQSTAFRTGIVLAQGGELGFLILTQAINYRVIDPEQQAILISAVVLSFIVSPILIRYNRKIVGYFFKTKDPFSAEHHKPHQLQEHSAELENHVIICGYARVGQVLARFLEQESIPYIALDLDPTRVSKTSLAGEKSFFGDAKHPDTLVAAGLARARMLVITISDTTSSLEILKHVRSMRLDIPVFVRTRDDSNLEAFQEAGATEVVPESLEGSLMLASHLLLTLGVPTHRILFKMRKIHANRYQFIKGIFEGQTPLTSFENDIKHKALHAITVSENAFAVGKTIQEIADFSKIPAPIQAVTRNHVRDSTPNPKMVIEPKDVLVLFATPEELFRLEEMIRVGQDAPKQ